MFESLVEKDEGSGKVRRRAFLATSVSAIAGLAVWSWRKTRGLREAIGWGRRKRLRRSGLFSSRTRVSD